MPPRTRPPAPRTPKPGGAPLRPEKPAPQAGAQTAGESNKTQVKTSVAASTKAKKPGATSKAQVRIEQAPKTSRGIFRVFSAKVIVLILALMLAAIIVTPTAVRYVEFRKENQQLVADLEVLKQSNDELENELGRWDDPKFIIAQARQRLSFVFPGETPYRVTDANPDTAGGQVISGQDTAEQQAAQERELIPAGSWYERVWQSVEAAS